MEQSIKTYISKNALSWAASYLYTALSKHLIAVIKDCSSVERCACSLHWTTPCLTALLRAAHASYPAGQLLRFPELWRPRWWHICEGWPAGGTQRFSVPWWSSVCKTNHTDDFMCVKQSINCVSVYVDKTFDSVLTICRYTKGKYKVPSEL